MNYDLNSELPTEIRWIDQHLLSSTTSAVLPALCSKGDAGREYEFASGKICSAATASIYG